MPKPKLTPEQRNLMSFDTKLFEVMIHFSSKPEGSEEDRLYRDAKALHDRLSRYLYGESTRV